MEKEPEESGGRSMILRDTSKPLAFPFTRDDVWVLFVVGSTSDEPMNANALFRMLRARFVSKRRGSGRLHLTAKGRRAIVDLHEKIADEKKRRAGFDA